MKCIRQGHFSIWHSFTLQVFIWDCKFDSYSCYIHFEIWISSKLFYLLLAVIKSFYINVYYIFLHGVIKKLVAYYGVSLLAFSVTFNISPLCQEYLKSWMLWIFFFLGWLSLSKYWIRIYFTFTGTCRPISRCKYIGIWTHEDFLLLSGASTLGHTGVK